jgi:hypothetical protein
MITLFSFTHSTLIYSQMQQALARTGKLESDRWWLEIASY